MGMEERAWVHHDADAGRPGRDATAGKSRRALCGQGLGPASAAPEGANSMYVIRKRIGQHAAALRSLLALFDAGDADALFAACGRKHPVPRGE